MEYSLRITSNPSNPSFDSVFHPLHYHSYEKHINTIPTFGINILPSLEASEIPLNIILPNKLSTTPPWQLPVPPTNLDIFLIHPPRHLQMNQYIVPNSLNWWIAIPIPICIPMDRRIKNLLLPLSISHLIFFPHACLTMPLFFTAELYAILLALQQIHHSTKQSCPFSDSLSALQALQT